MFQKVGLVGLTIKLNCLVSFIQSFLSSDEVCAFTILIPRHLPQSITKSPSINRFYLLNYFFTKFVEVMLHFSFKKVNFLLPLLPETVEVTAAIKPHASNKLCSDTRLMIGSTQPLKLGRNVALMVITAVTQVLRICMLKCLIPI